MALELPEEESRRKAAIGFTLLIAFLFGVVMVRLVQIQVVGRAEYRRLAENNAVRLVIRPAARGVIRDRHGEIIVDSVPSFSLAVDPLNPAARRLGIPVMLQRIAFLLNVPVEELQERYAKQRGQSFGPVTIRRNIDMRGVAAIEEHRSDLPGVTILTEPLRHYPGRSAAHVLGYLGEITEEELEKKREESYRPGDMVGRAGVEKQYEKYLRGRDGIEYVTLNALGQRIGTLIDRPARAPVRGPDLYLTLDMNVQRAAEAAFPESLRGGLVALDPRDGGVLAMVSRPTYDPAEFAVGLKRGRWKEFIDDTAFPLLARPIQAAYPPGSTWKPLTSLAAFEDGRVTPEQRFVPCGGGYFFGNRYFRCWLHSGHGSQDFLGALTRSCDTYYYQVGLREGIDGLARWAKETGLIGRTGIDLPQERKSFVPDVAWYNKHRGERGWGKGVVLSLAIGQAEIIQTPLSLAAFYSLLVNGGRRVTPHVQLKTDDPTGVAEAPAPVAPPRPLGIRPEILHDITEALAGVVESPGGTGGRARIPGVRVGGKTGTAQNPHGEDHAWFVGVAPVDSARVVVAVIVENVGHGGTHAAPIARKVMEAVVRPNAPPSGSTVDSLAVVSD